MFVGATRMGMRPSAVVTFAIVLAWLAVVSSTRAQSDELELEPGMLVVKVVELENDRGKVGCALYRGEKGFPDEQKHAVKGTLARIRERRATCVFRGVPEGEYALAVLHDENSNGELDTNIFGVPTEGYGVSNNAEAGTFGPPSYEDARFRYDGSPRVMRIKLRY